MHRLLASAVTAIALLSACNNAAQTPKPSTSETPAAPAQPRGLPLSDVRASIISTLIDNEIESLTNGGDSMLAIEEGIIAVTAAELVKTFKENELAADEKFKAKHVLVTGGVESIQKDALGTPLVTLKGPRAALDVVARFTDASIPLLTKLKAGEQTSLLCSVKGERITFVILVDCKLPSEFRAELKAKYQQKAVAVAGLVTPAKQSPAATTALMLTLVEEKLRATNPDCLTKPTPIAMCMNRNSVDDQAPMAAAVTEMSERGIDMKSALPSIVEIGSR
jgi:hypothetical protein